MCSLRWSRAVPKELYLYKGKSDAGTVSPQPELPPRIAQRTVLFRGEGEANPIGTVKLHGQASTEGARTGSKIKVVN